jgi:hypothetical protein
MDLIFLREATKRKEEEETSALLILAVLSIDKEMGVIGKEMGDYFGDEVRQMSISKAKQLAGCGLDEIHLKLMNLITYSLYVI